jgi:hypothetical protein
VNVEPAVRASAFVVFLFLLVVARPARAEGDRASLEQAALTEDPQVAGEALYQLAELEDAAFEFPAALEHYQGSAARSPSGRFAARAGARATALRTHAEGDFAPLTRLERVRRDPALANDPRAIDALARDADAFPPGRVRVEARMLVAEAYLGRLRRPTDALPVLRTIVADPHADVLTSRLAAKELVETLASAGQLDAAVATARALSNKLEPSEVRAMERLVRRRGVHQFALGDLAFVLLLAILSFVGASRRRALPLVVRELRRFAPLALGYTLYAGIVGGWLASSYESGNATPFFALAVATLVLVLLARAWGAAGSARPAARAARAMLCASSIVASGFLLLERIDPTYLEGFGL